MEELIDSGFDAPGFSVRTGHYLAWASNFAYEDTDAWARRLGLHEAITVFTCGQFHGFVGKFSRGAVVALRGTQSIENCFTDAETALVRRSPYPGRVHHGFADGVDEVWPEVRRLLGNPAHCGPVWVTGHSLGGAMATLASVRLNYEGYRVRAVYTYGSPRPGDTKFRRNYRLPNYRFVNHNDMVPHLPFLWCFEHVGELKLLDLEEGLLENESDWEDRKAQLAKKAKRIQRECLHTQIIEEFCEWQRDMEWLDDHLLDRYLAAIERLLPRVPRRRVTGAFSKVRDMMPDLGESESQLVAHLEGPRSLPSNANVMDGPPAPPPVREASLGKTSCPDQLGAGTISCPAQPPAESDASLENWWASAVARAQEAGQTIEPTTPPYPTAVPQPLAEEPQGLPPSPVATLADRSEAVEHALPKVADHRETVHSSEQGPPASPIRNRSEDNASSSEGQSFLDVRPQLGGNLRRRAILPPWGDQPSIKQCFEEKPIGPTESSGDPLPAILPISKGKPQPARPPVNITGTKPSVSAREVFSLNATPLSGINSAAGDGSTSPQANALVQGIPATRPARSESEIVAAFCRAVSKEKTAEPTRRQA